MNAFFVTDLAARWRAEADRFEELGQPGARLVVKYAEELEEAAQKWELEAIPIEQAVKESGYSPVHLRDLARKGSVEHFKRAGRLFFLRYSLPRKAGGNGQAPFKT